MAILTTLLQGLNGISGGLQGNMGVQVLGSASIDFSAEGPVSVYSPVINSGAHIVVTEAIVRMPNGPPKPTATGYPLQISVRLGGVQIIIINLNPNNMELSVPCYSYGNLQGTPPLGVSTGISAAMLVPSSGSKMGYVDVIGYGASAS